jgi:hypothetical protein
MIDLKCDQDLVKLGIINAGGWNILAFWDHLDSCDKCREAEAALIDELNRVMNGEQESEETLASQR